MKIAVLCFTFLYLVLEAITASQSTSLFFVRTDLNNLNQIEQLGYITAGLGTAVLVLSKCKTRNMLSILIIGFLTFGVTSHGLHWLMDRAPKLFSIQMKQLGVYYGIGVLTEPSPRWIASAYGIAAPENFQRQALVNFVSSYGLSDGQSRQMLAAGIRGIGLFSKQWDLTVQKLDQQKLQSDFKKLHRGVYEMHFAKAGKLRDRKQELPLPYWRSMITPPIDKGAQYALSRNRNWNAHEAAWWAMRERFEFLPIEPQPLDNWLETFNRHLTQNALLSYLPDTNGAKMPWRGQQAYGPLYQQVCEEVAPFLFHNGKPLLNLASLRDPQVRDTYVYELKKPLSDKLQRVMYEYQLDNLTKLIQTSSAWDNSVRSDAGIGLARLIWLTPIMTMLSWGLLLANTWRLAHLLTKDFKGKMPVNTRQITSVLLIVLVLVAAQLIVECDVWQTTIKHWLLILGPQTPNIRIV